MSNRTIIIYNIYVYQVCKTAKLFILNMYLEA